MISSKFNYIRKKVDLLIKANRSFFFTIKNNDICYTNDKIKGEYLIYLIVNNYQDDILNSRKIIDSLYAEYSNQDKYFDDLISNEQVQVLWVRSLMNSSFYTYDLQIKDILLKSTVFLEKDVSSYNFLDLYNFTHDVMFSADFGSNKIFSDFSKDTQDSIWRKAKTNLYLALLSKHVDLLFEYVITLLILNKAANYKYKKELTALFNLVYESFILPYFQDNKRINKKNYHTFLVLGLLSGTYERTKRNTRENTKIIE